MIKSYELTKEGTAGTDIFDLTDDVQELLSRSAVQSGSVLVFVPGSTAAVTTIEFEGGVLEDLKRAIERLAPSGERYAHDAAWGDGNGYAHVRSALLGPSCVVPVTEGRLALGTWQQVILLDFDNRPRRRRVIVQVCGEKQ